MIRADLVSNRIKPGLFRDVTLGNFFREKKKKGIKWLHSLKKLLLVRKGRAGPVKPRGCLKRFLFQQRCEISVLEIRALSPTRQEEGVIHTGDLDGIEKTLGLTDSLLQSCSVQAVNLIFQQKMNISADHSPSAFPWLLPHELWQAVVLLNKITLWLCLSFP